MLRPPGGCGASGGAAIRPSVALVLALLVVVVVAICELEAALAARRWRSEDLGRTPDLSALLLPGDARPQSEDALVTIRVETPHAVRVYHYRVEGQATPAGGFLRPFRAPAGLATSPLGRLRLGGPLAPSRSIP